MIESALMIQAVEYADGLNDRAEEARVRYKNEYPGRSARRMTHLGMMVGLCLQKMDMDRGIPVIYASGFGESASLEKFIDSFPEASPALFQSSIHPSAVEQALIPGKQSIDRFYPITSDRNLAGKALENCFLLGDEAVVLVGGEERGAWLCEFDLASRESFAFSIKLVQGNQGIGRVILDRDHPVTLAGSPGFPSFASAMRDRQPMRVPSFALDAWMCIEWL